MAKEKETKKDAKKKKGETKGESVDLRGKQDQDLRFEEEKLRKELFELRLKAAGEGVSNPARIPQIRKDVARIHTILQERKLGVRAQASR